MRVNLCNNLCHPFCCKPVIFTTLKYKGAEPQFITDVAAGKNLRRRQAVTQNVGIAFPDTAVIAIVVTVVGKFNQSADINIMAIFADTDCFRLFKKISLQCIRTVFDQKDPFIA